MAETVKPPSRAALIATIVSHGLIATVASWAVTKSATWTLVTIAALSMGSVTYFRGTSTLRAAIGIYLAAFVITLAYVVGHSLKILP